MNIMKNLSKIAFVALCSCLIFSSCSKEDVLPVNPANDVINPKLDQIADFKVILPKGNQVIADGVDQVQYEIMFYDASGNVINDKLPVLTDVIGKVEVDGQKMYLPSAMKASKVGNYNVIITAGKITKSIPIVATTAEKKIVEIPIIFNFVSTDYSDKVVELTFTNLVETYKRNGLDNVVFKLAEIDNDGKPLARKGVKFWNYNGVATDQMDYKKLWGNKYAFDVYLIDNKTVDGASAYANPDHIVIDNSFFRQPDKVSLDDFGFLPFCHEMGHVFGLKHVYRDDNICQVQEGVNDIQAVSSDPNKQGWDWKNNTLTTICGGKQIAGNVMGYGDALKPRYLTPDQIKVAKKAALSVSF
jgi:hypothetical protein